MAKSEKGSGRLGSSIQLGANIENLRYKNQAALPNQHENDAQLFADIGKSFSAPGDRPRGVWRNFGAGIAKGLEYGAKSQAIGEKKDDFDKYENVMNYFQEVNNSAIEQNQWYENRERQLETIKPFAIGGLEVSYSGMDYGTGNERMRNIMEQAKLADPSIKGDYVGYIPNTPIVNMRDADGNITAFSLSSIVGEDVVKRVQGNYVDQQKLNIEKQYAPIKYDIQGKRIAETARRNDQADLKHDLKLSETIGKKIDASRAFLTIAPKMRDIVKNHPDIFQSAKDAVWRESKEPGYINNMIKDIQNKLEPDKVAALTTMTKYINQMTLDVTSGFSRPTMFIEKIGSKAVPNLDMNPQGFMKVLDEMEEENRTSIKNNQARLELLESDLGTGISDQYRESTADVMGEPEVTGASNDNADLSDMGVRVR